MQLILILALPLLGSTLGAACVFFLKKGFASQLEKLLLGFASGVMVAASVWSLIIPAIEASSAMNKFAFVPAACGVAFGFLFLFLLDEITPHLHTNATEPEGITRSVTKAKKTTLMFLAVTLHNIPEGMAVGVVLASVISGLADINTAAAFSIALGIALQNFPEGAIVSLPLISQGKSKLKSFLFGFASGAVEPIAALITLWLSGFIKMALPYLLAFAAGSMLYVVVEELVPQASEGKHSNNGTIGFALGFILMMILDVALG